MNKLIKSLTLIIFSINIAQATTLPIPSNKDKEYQQHLKKKLSECEIKLFSLDAVESFRKKNGLTENEELHISGFDLEMAMRTDQELRDSMSEISNSVQERLNSCEELVFRIEKRKENSIEKIDENERESVKEALIEGAIFDDCWGTQPHANEK